MIVCKFQCQSVTKTTTAETVKLTAVSGKANEPWSKWTPSGLFEVSITNPDAFGAFTPGKNYHLNVSEAPAES
jgi:hypothetical protein